MRSYFAIAVMLALSFAGSGWAQERLSLPEARRLASGLIDQNQPAAAREIALGLLQADPNDVDALILLSRAERLMGNTDAAVDAGRAAWRAAQNDAERFVAASVVAQAHARAENYGRAQIWLRRAAQVAPTPDYAALATQDFQRVRQANPWSVNLSFGAMPSNNVNNGNSNNTLTFAYLPGALANLRWEVPADDRPLSGVAVTGQVQLSYRLAQSPQSKTAVSLTLFGQGYVLSDRAKRTAPDVTARSLGYQQATLGIAHTWAPEGSSGPYSIDLSFTRAFYGSNPYTGDVALTFARQWNRSDGQVFSASFEANQTTYLSDNSRADGLSLRGAWQRTRANDDVIGLSFSASEVYADRPDRGYTAFGAQASYDFGEVAKGVEFAVSGSIEKRSYDLSSYDPAGRNDIRSTLQVSVGLPMAAFYGFEPVATVSADRTNSSVPYFETESVRMGLQIKSSF